MQSPREKLVDVLSDRRARLAAGALATAGAAGAAKLALGGRGSGVEERPSRAFRLQPDEGAAEGLRRVAAGRAGRAAARLREAAEGAEDPARTVHAARKDLKKLRSVARLLRPELGEEGYRAESSRYREAGRLLSASRDAEVKVRTLEALLERSAGPRPDGAAEWLSALREERERALPDPEAGAPATLYEALALVEEGRGRIAAWPLDSGGWGLVRPGLERAYRGGRRGMRRAAGEPGPEALHRWRKRVKDLWYQLRVLEGAVPEDLAGATARADRLSEALGEHHDLAVLRDDLEGRELAASPRARAVATISLRQSELAREAFELGERLYAEKAKQFRKRMRAGWRAWKEQG